ncbi:methyl-accepting chemotaxis protein [Salsuginibacillus halophilus]|uniref:methyl-accepting chemotaxis protein n=1 Tax=Salsuginibacillus halophilus TaxID=517424 RepID=UPI001FE3FAB6|nr:methyl-accepting chemotaxis protein [Salsuginibacillus halophilus]
MTLRKKLIGGFLGVAVVLSIAISIALTQMSQMSDTFDFLVHNETELRNNVADMEAAINRQSSYFRGYLLTESQDYYETFEAANEEIEDLIHDGRQLAQFPETLQAFNEILELNREYADEAGAALDLSPDNAVTYASTEVIPVGVDMENIVQELMNDIDTTVQTGADQALTGADQAFWVTTIVSFIAILIAVFGGVFISNRIAGPVKQLSKAAGELAEGDLSRDSLKVKNKDEIGELAQSFEAMKQNLRGMITRISASSQSVAASSEQMTRSAEETSNATSQITESIQEVAGGSDQQLQSTTEAKETSKEINEGMGQIAETVEQVSESSAKTGENAMNGLRVIDETVQQIKMLDEQSEDIVQKVNNLNELSEQIDSIIAMITNIAEQTNLLALNAAIEAARAGEHGKGFAVVADEVRKLAEQSNQSAQEVSGLVTQIQEGIGTSAEMVKGGRNAARSGLDHVEEARHEFTAIHDSVQSVTGQIEEVVAAVEEMSAGTESLDKQIQSTAEVAASTSSYAQNVAASAEEQMASMEEVSTSAETLASMAEELEKEVRQFQLDQKDEGSDSEVLVQENDNDT